MTAAGRRPRATWLLAALLLVGCRTWRPIPVERVDLGDQVRVVTIDGKEHTFEVTFVGDRAFGGQGVTVPVDELTSVRVEGPTAAATIFTGLLEIKQTRFILLVGLMGLIVVIAA